MEVRVTPIRFSSGQLISQRTVWIGNYNTPVTIKQRTLLEIRSPDVPTKRFPKSTIDSNKNQYLLFGATSAYKDVSTFLICRIFCSNYKFINDPLRYHQPTFDYFFLKCSRRDEDGDNKKQNKNKLEILTLQKEELFKSLPFANNV